MAASHRSVHLLIGILCSAACSSRLDVSDITAGYSHTCAVRPSGQAYCWGSNASGELGYSTVGSMAAPGPVSGGLTFTMIDAGNASTCALTPAGDAWCWGSNTAGQLGNGTTAASGVPVMVVGGKKFNSISVGMTHACGVAPTGDAWCWGANNHSQLGNGTIVSSNTPVPVAGGISFAAISAGMDHTCGIDLSGTGWCWGSNNYGMLGIGVDDFGHNVATPAAVNGGIVFESISAGKWHTCGVAVSGAGYCWGDNEGGMLGDNDPAVHKNVPTAVHGGIVFASITAGPLHTCGIDTSTQAYCWGNDVVGQTGLGGASAYVPTALTAGRAEFSKIDGGMSEFSHSCGRGTDGFAYCWGSNDDGQLGRGGPSVDIPTPVIE